MEAGKRLESGMDFAVLLPWKRSCVPAPRRSLGSRVLLVELHRRGGWDVTVMQWASTEMH